MQYLVEREVWEIVQSVAYPVRPIVNATVVLVLLLLAAVPVSVLTGFPATPFVSSP
jgi:hypothetical protein